MNFVFFVCVNTQICQSRNLVQPKSKVMSSAASTSENSVYKFAYSFTICPIAIA